MPCESLRGLQRGVLGAIGEYDDDFLAPISKHEVGRPGAIRDGLGDMPQSDVACLMAVEIVDRLEVIDIDEEQAEPWSFRLFCSSISRIMIDGMNCRPRS